MAKLIQDPGSGVANQTSPVAGTTGYSLPIASATILGGIKVGSGLTIDPDTGVLTAAAQQYILPPATHSVLGGVIVGANLSVDGAGVINYTLTSNGITTALGYTPYNATNPAGYLTTATLPVASTSTPGVIKVGAAFTMANGVLNYTNPNPTPYVLHTASTTTLGGVKVDGTTIIINNGVISGAQTYTLPTATSTILGGIKVGTTLGIVGGVLNYTNPNPTPYTLPTATNAVLGGIKVGTTLGIVNGVLNYTNPNPTPYSLPTASTSTLGGVKIDGTTITISNGVISGAQTYTLPIATTSVLGGVKPDGTTITANSLGVISAAAGYTLPTASNTTKGGIKVPLAAVVPGTSGYDVVNFGGNLVGTNTFAHYGLTTPDFYNFNFVANHTGGPATSPGTDISLPLNGMAGITPSSPVNDFLSLFNAYFGAAVQMSIVGGNLVMTSQTTGVNSNVQCFTPTGAGGYAGLYESMTTAFVGYNTGVNGTAGASTDPGVSMVGDAIQLNIASASDLGGIRVGSGLTIDSSATLRSAGVQILWQGVGPSAPIKAVYTPGRPYTGMQSVFGSGTGATTPPEVAWTQYGQIWIEVSGYYVLPLGYTGDGAVQQNYYGTTRDIDLILSVPRFGSPLFYFTSQIGCYESSPTRITYLSEGYIDNSGYPIYVGSDDGPVALVGTGNLDVLLGWTVDPDPTNTGLYGFFVQNISVTSTN